MIINSFIPKSYTQKNFNDQNLNSIKTEIKDKTAAHKILGYKIDEKSYLLDNLERINKQHKINLEKLNLSLKPDFVNGFYTASALSQNSKNTYESSKQNFPKDLGNFTTENQAVLGSKTTIVSKILGYDKSISKQEFQDFQHFMNANRIKNPFTDPRNFALPPDNGQELLSTLVYSKESFEAVMAADWNFQADIRSLESSVKSTQKYYKGEFATQANNINKDYHKLLENDKLSLQEFKEEYLKLKQRHDDLIDKIKGITKAKDADFATTQESKIQKNFISVQVRSQKFIYKKEDVYKEFFLDFIKTYKDQNFNTSKLLKNLYANGVDLKV